MQYHKLNYCYLSRVKIGIMCKDIDIFDQLTGKSN